MYITHCKLNGSEQLDLMKYFVAGGTARTAAGKVAVFRLLKRGGKVSRRLFLMQNQIR
jgi:transposase-like protein